MEPTMPLDSVTLYGGTAPPPLPPLTDEQQYALDVACTFMEGGSRQQVLQIDGHAGTGKTTVLAALAQRFPDIPVIAPTGRAAEVLRRKIGRETSTIHREIYKVVGAGKKEDGGSGVRFAPKHSKDSRLGGVVLLDEHSMVDTEIGGDIAETGIRVVAFGDPGQLQPVTDNPRFFNSADITLRQIHRQAANSPIVRQAYRVRDGGDYCSDGPAFQVREKVGRDELMNADIVLCWTNPTRQRLNSDIRRLKGFAGQPRAGEPVMCTKNAPTFRVYNGGIYPLVAFLDGLIVVDVDGRETAIPKASFEGMPDMRGAKTSFQFGYAATVHKAQGSEWANVLLIDDYVMPDRRNWLYTALTRASQSVVVAKAVDVVL
jgi:exodeoxyribonuclease-5